MIEWNLNVQRELPGSLVMSLAYVGAKGSHVDMVGLNINQAIPAHGAVVRRRCYPNLSDAIGVCPCANDIYHAMQTSSLNVGGGSQFPNRVASGLLPSEQRSIDRWFDASAFIAPAQFVFGNSGRNILRGPGTKQLDISLFKSFALGEKGDRRLQF